MFQSQPIRSKSPKAPVPFPCFDSNAGEKHVQRTLVTFRQCQCDRQGRALSMRGLVSSRVELALTFAFCVDSVLGTWHPPCLPETSHYGTHLPKRSPETCARLTPLYCSPSSWIHNWHLYALKVQHSLSLLPTQSCWKENLIARGTRQPS